ncbi:hypothetical protein [Catenovulum adriaticum]|uniref:Lipoprotein n=1 Tax=Catenovulum adriaticum TaxID=2984846 RepID=A0ABY7AMP7_9ALTE|nr:hypothetical protein [Catenovulum sp. TS8]WAJ70493.1 hypothetical protein OLW01_01350 [Catenovulum sp. TS8]
MDNKLVPAFIACALMASCGGGSSDGNDAANDNGIPFGIQDGMPVSGVYLSVRGYTPDRIITEDEQTDGAAILIDKTLAIVHKGHSFLIYNLSGDRKRLNAEGRLYNADGSFKQNISSIGLAHSTELNGVEDYSETVELHTYEYNLVTKKEAAGRSVSNSTLYSGLTYLEAPFTTLAGNWVAEDGISSFAINTQGDITGSDQSGCQWEGRLTQPDSNRSVFKSNLTLTGCNRAGNYTMFAGFTTLEDYRVDLSNITFNNDFADSDNWTKQD